MSHPPQLLLLYHPPRYSLSLICEFSVSPTIAFLTTLNTPSSVRWSSFDCRSSTLLSTTPAENQIEVVCGEVRWGGCEVNGEGQAEHTPCYTLSGGRQGHQQQGGVNGEVGVSKGVFLSVSELDLTSRDKLCVGKEGDGSVVV
ncbi:hypothetical protein E2C01_023684 [Portunus trituberculatus]|uniref:Uncharacterized protein n=1 Tax=Portunus trituberculatus TaxID=210409 RepID=A0A5B7E8K8_PORTR|nr:hypothetical protein [Portunus trituberculatus]